MKAYTFQQWSDLKALCVAAAIEIVVGQGWAMLSVRNVGDRIGRSGTAIQRIFPGIALKREVIDAAFDELLIALLPFTEAEPPPLANLYRTILAHLRREHGVPPLVLQVMAQLGAGGGEADAVAQVVADARGATIVRLDHVLGAVAAAGGTRAPDPRRLMRWYVAACCLIATDSPDDAELLEMAGTAA